MFPQTRRASRGGRYRKKLLEPEGFLPFAAALETLFAELDAMRASASLSDAEFTGYGLLALLACRRADALQPYGRSSGSMEPGDEDPKESALPPFLFLRRLRDKGLPVQNESVPWTESSTLLRFLSRIRFRGIPDSARMALTQWLEGRYPLGLFFLSPSAEDVFEMQKAGRRCITFFKRADELAQWHQGRDALSFVVHDLIHAHEFYADPQRAKQQIGFYHWLDSIRNHNLLSEWMRTSPSFLARWEYVLADMNSYCGHLLKTLHAAFIQEAPPGVGSRNWESVVMSSRLSESQRLLFLKVNTGQWGPDEFLELERVLEGIADRAGVP
jgi:hypothetical protein